MRYRVEELAHRFAGIIINQKLIDIPLKRAEERGKGITDYQSIDINSVTHNVTTFMKRYGIGLTQSLCSASREQISVAETRKAKSGNVIYVKKCSEPERKVAQIYQALNYSDRPFWHVLPESGKPKKEVIDTG